MAGATLELDSLAVTDALGRAIAVLRDPQRIQIDMGEYLLRAHILRFAAQVSPDGVPWAPLSPRYQKRKKKNRDRILFLDGYLANTMRYQVMGGELLFGSNRPYAALMHFGGEVQRAARSQELYFKRNRDGSVGNRFVKKKRSDFAQTATVGSHKVRYPARPFLGTSDQDNLELLQITIRHWDRAIGG